MTKIRKVAFTCQYCGKIKYVRPSYAKRAKYCSRECVNCAGKSKETINKIRAKLKGRKQTKKHVSKRIDSGKVNNSYQRFGNKNSFYGKKHKQKTKEKNRQMHIGKKQSKEAKEKNRLANSGENSARWIKKVSVVCQHCGKIKEVTPYVAKTKKYCSQQCHYSAGMTEQQKKQTRIARLKQIFPIKDSSIEIKMQNILKENNIKFVKHKSLLNKYQVDIFIEPNIVIECDGDYWHNRPGSQEKDKIRDKNLKLAGHQVLRFWEYKINNDIEKCFSIIYDTITN